MHFYLLMNMHFKNTGGGLTYVLHKYPGIPVYMKFHHFSAHHRTFKNEKRQQFDMQLVYYIRLKFEIMLTFIFQSCEW